MGLGGYVLSEWKSVSLQEPEFQNSWIKLEEQAIKKCTNDWFPKKTPMQACGYLTPVSGEQFGRTSVLPALFDDINQSQMAHWRQQFLNTQTGHQTIMTGTNAGNVLPEDFKVAWIGLAFPNKNQHITEIKFQIGDRKFGRLNLEEMLLYDKPAVIFKEGVMINEEESFHLYAYVDGPLPNHLPFIQGVYQRVVLLGAAYYRVIDKVLGSCGAAIT